MKGDNMISYILAWGIWTVVLGAIMLIWVMVRKKSISATKFGAYLIYAIIMICVGIVTFVGEDDSKKQEIHYRLF